MKKTSLRKFSKKMAQQKRREADLIQELLVLCEGLCECCGNAPDWRGLSKHEPISRARGGSAVDPLNALMCCGDCHNHRKYPLTGTPLSTERQLEIARERSC